MEAIDSFGIKLDYLDNMKKYTLLTAILLTIISMTQAQTQKDLEAVFSSMAKRDSSIEAYLIANKIFNAQGTAEGIYYTISEQGAGEKAKATDFVKVHYRGTLLNGNQFDSSFDRNEPIDFQLGVGRVIPGWEKGLTLFAKGGKGSLFLPSDLAYGNRAIGNIIPANAVLRFDIEMVDVTSQDVYYEQMKARQLRERAIADSLAKIQTEKERSVIQQYATEKGLAIQTTPSGLAYVIERQGEGPKVTIGKQATVHYAGYLLNGTKFDASYDRNQPFTLTVGVGSVIQGWDEGLQLLNQGGKIKLIIPSAMGYGANGAGAVIPPNAVLVFDVEVLEVK